MGSPKRFRPSRSLARKKDKIEPGFKIFAFCEGLNTEPKFIEDFIRENSNGLVTVITIGAAGSPFKIVSTAVTKKKELDEIAKLSMDSLDEKFEVWAVFDKDEHPKIPEAFQKAEANNVYIAYSNPCFEIWPILHFKNQTAPIHRHQLQSDLGKLIPNYKKKGSKEIVYSDLPNAYAEAKLKAIALGKDHIAIGTPFGNPYTDVFKLFDKIIKNGK
ncbi:RloB family protein [Shewanella sp. AC91-MNA-CIBAN-0169]|uniref:RloB family protein n=1 Tax=Shewanella sp. AC91-MNA-CIBAN-0169 TaxID=3140466 RepID=UPI00332A00CC